MSTKSFFVLQKPTGRISSDLRWLVEERRANWSGKPLVHVDGVCMSLDGRSWQRPAHPDYLLAVLRERFSKATYSDELNAAIEKLATDMLRPFGVLGFWEEGKP